MEHFLIGLPAVHRGWGQCVLAELLSVPLVNAGGKGVGW